MRLISMTATYGKLEGQTLHLEPGLNVISAPNEWGKSTWCSFLVAMLYGVDTRERSTRDALAEKEKYAPWSGRPMEGTLRIEYEGRDITIQRRSRGRVPLGEFQAYETRTGLPVPQLTAENCGLTLLGVERSVFQRTGFIRFSDLTVTPDESLWRRLQSLVTTGEEGDTLILERKLRELKNKCRSSRGGLIPETEASLQQLQTQLEQRQKLAQRCTQLESQADSARRELEALERHKGVLAYRAALANPAETQAAAQNAKDARDACEALEEQCRAFPVRSLLKEKLQQSQTLLTELQNTPDEPTPSLTPILVLGVLAMLALLGAGGLMIQRLYAATAVAGAAALLLALAAGRMESSRRRTLLRQKLAQNERERRIQDLMEHIGQWQHQLSLREELEQARRLAEQTRIQLQSLVAMARQAAADEEADELELSEEETLERIQTLNTRLGQYQILLGQCQGRMEAYPPEEHLARQLELQQTRLTRLLAHERAIDQAIDAWEEASRELQRRFAPRITRLAGEYLHRLTGGRYHRLTLGEDLALQSATQAEATLRPRAWRSEGTQDQMALSLRLAMWVTLNPAGPLVLDDALVRMDDTRLESAMGLLKELAQTRQIILFSCQEREKQLL